MKKWPLALLLFALLAWASIGILPDLPRVVTGIPFALDYISNMWPPDWSVLPGLSEPLCETLSMAILGITLAACIAMPASFVAARNTAPNVWLYFATRGFFDLVRSIPTLLWAILFVSWMGLGPLAGVAAITLHCVGTLGKYFSESIEAVGPTIKDYLDAQRIDGANEWQVMMYGLMPAVGGLFTSYVLYYLEWAIRTATILGLVGAGGIGLRLVMTIRLFKRQESAAIIVVILALVLGIDVISRQIRKVLVR